jgi:hypothetical protein
MLVTIESEVLSALLEAAESHKEDLDTGVEDGIYEEGCSEVLEKAIETVQLLLQPYHTEYALKLFDDGKIESEGLLLHVLKNYGWTERRAQTIIDQHKEHAS